jgi:hypothetical protein
VVDGFARLEDDVVGLVELWEMAGEEDREELEAEQRGSRPNSTRSTARRCSRATTPIGPRS